MGAKNESRLKNLLDAQLTVRNGTKKVVEGSKKREKIIPFFTKASLENSFHVSVRVPKKLKNKKDNSEKNLGQGSQTLENEKMQFLSAKKLDQGRAVWPGRKDFDLNLNFERKERKFLGSHCR